MSSDATQAPPALPADDPAHEPPWRLVLDRLAGSYARLDAMQDAPAEARKPMDHARRYALLHDIADDLAVLTKENDDRKKALGEMLMLLMEDEQLPPDGFKADGRSIHINTQVWFGPADNHQALTAVMRDLIAAHHDGPLARELEVLLPKTIHSGQLSSWCREYLDPATLTEDGRPMTYEDRLRSPNPKPMPEALIQALKASPKPTVRAPRA